MTELDLSGRTFGEFLLRERIGVGGHGTVYRAEQRGLGRDAVVKVLRPRKPDGAGAERFVREAKLASRLDHPYSAHVYAFGVEPDGVRWIAMELVHGVSLGEWLRARGPMPLALFVPFLDLVAEVVHAAHRSGIVHRDLKPSNVMVVESGPRWLPKLLDFGIARPFDASAGSDEEDPADGDDGRDATTARLRKEPPPYRTRTGPDPEAARLTPHGAVLGSAPYMSPEQWREPWNVGPAADVYALGCLAHEALTGRTPYSAADGRGYYELHACAEPPSLGGDFPSGVDRAIRRALAKLPTDRQESALDLAAELRAALRAEPHQQLRAAAQQWEDRARPPDLLWGRRVLADVERCVPPTTMSELECSFVAESHRRARRVRWTARSLAVLAVAAAGAVLVGRSAMETRLAEERARIAEQQVRLEEQRTRAERDLKEARITESELEQGRSALLHGEPEAQRHLAEAYRRDPAPATAFMLARSMQPRLAEMARLVGTHGRMWWATFSPDGRQIATADDRAAQIWDGETYRLLFTLPHGCEVSQAVYSPDGARLVTVARAMVRIWDAKTGVLLRELKANPGSAPSDFDGAAVSPDGSLVAAIDASGGLTRVWDMRRAAPVAEVRTRAAGTPLLAFGDGWLATTGGEEARVFDAHGWKQVLSVPGPVRSLAAGPRDRLVIGTAAGEVSIWEVRSAARLRQLRPFGEPVEAVAFSRDGASVAGGSRDGTLQAWQADSGALRSQLNTRHGRILWVDFDPAAGSLLAAHHDGTVVVADVRQGLAVATLDGPTSAVRVARFAPGSGSRVLGASLDGTARVWEAASSYRRFASPPAGSACNVGLGSSPDRRFIAVGCRDLPTRVWDTAQDRLLAELPNSTPLEADGFISAAPAVSAAGDLAAIPRAAAVEVYGLSEGRLLRTIRHGAAVSAIAFADSGRAIASGALDGSVRVVREDGTELALQASGGVTAAALLPDGRIIVADAERRLRIFAADGTVLADLPIPVRIMSLRRSGARVVALSSHDGEAGPPLLVDLDASRIVARLEGHSDQVFSARWVSADRVLTAGGDGTARLWDGTTGRLLRTFGGAPRFLADATLMSGVVVAGGADGLLRFWDTASGAKLWTLPAHKSMIIGVHAEGDDIVTRAITGEISRWRLPQSAAVIAACARHPPCGIVP